MLSEYFLTVENIFAIGLNTSVLGIVAMGQMLCILSSDFDLSVGNTACITGIMIFPAPELPMQIILGTTASAGL